MIVRTIIFVSHLWPERHRIQAVAPGQLSDLFEAHAVLHNVHARAVEDLFAIPSPDALPSLVWVDLERIENHDKASRSAVGRVCLRRELLRKLEIILH